MSNTRTGIAIVPILVIIFAVTAFGAVTYFALPLFQSDTNTSTTNTAVHANTNIGTTGWKTYTNTETGLTFTYPADRITREYQNPFEVRVMDVNDEKKDEARFTGDVAGPGDIGITQLATYYADPQKYLSTTFTLRAETEKTTVAGETAYRVTYSQPLATGQDDLVLYVFNHKGKTWLARLDLTGIAGEADDNFEVMVKSIAFGSKSASVKTYTNTKYGFSIIFPEAWGQISEYDGTKRIIADTADDSATFGTALDDSSPSFYFTILDRRPGNIIHRNTLEYWKIVNNVIEESDVQWGKLNVKSFLVADEENRSYVFEHGDYFYQFFPSNHSTEASLAVLQTLTLTNPDAVTPKYTALPFKKITNISEQFGSRHDGEMEATTSVMGSKALIGSWGKLFYYDGTTAKDISSFMTNLPQGGETPLYVRGLGNNGKYWLVAIANDVNSYLYKFDGTTWTDITKPFLSSARTIGGPVQIVWNGSYFLIAANPYSLIKYQGNTFTNINDLFPINMNYFSVGDMGWNGKYFLIPISADIHTRMYKYDGSKVSEMPGFDSNKSYVYSGWNGSYWLLGEGPDQKLIKYDGNKVTKTELIADRFPRIAWLKTHWLVSRSISNGQNIEPVPEFSSLKVVTAISLGTNYGIILDGSGLIYRFDF